MSSLKAWIRFWPEIYRIRIRAGFLELGHQWNQVPVQHAHVYMVRLYLVESNANAVQEMYGLMSASPHLLLLPSDLVYFVRELDNCTVINPGRLTKGAGPGTFSKILMKSENGKVSFKAEVVRI